MAATMLLAYPFVIHVAVRYIAIRSVTVIRVLIRLVRQITLHVYVLYVGSIIIVIMSIRAVVVVETIMAVSVAAIPVAVVVAVVIQTLHH
jgi:hypothetical protein